MKSLRSSFARSRRRLSDRAIRMCVVEGDYEIRAVDRRR